MKNQISACFNYITILLICIFSFNPKPVFYGTLGFVSILTNFPDVCCSVYNTFNINRETGLPCFTLLVLSENVAYS